MAAKQHRVRNPWSGEFDFQFSEVSRDEISEICTNLKVNQQDWAATGLDARLVTLRDFADALRAHENEIVSALIDDTGRERIALIEFELMFETIDRVINDAPAALAARAPQDTRVEPIRASQQYVPYGLLLNISPWNFPLILSFIDVLPALAAGNSVVIKPSEVTPRWIEPVRSAIADVPKLDAILEILAGDGALGARIMQSCDVVSFTGSVATGKIVNEAAARLFIPAFLELGGKDPAIVLGSADVDYATQTIVFSSMSASGQACQSLELAIVDESIYESFVERAVDCARKLTINHPDRSDGFVGPFIMERQADVVADQLKDAVSRGAKILCGGEVTELGGKWLPPTVLTDVTPDMKIMREETFGPVLPIVSVATREEAIETANATTYGLSASVFAGSVDEARSVATCLNAGAVNINDASLTSRVHDTAHESFGWSGLGRSRFGQDGFLRYVRRKAILENNSGKSVVAG